MVLYFNRMPDLSLCCNTHPRIKRKGDRHYATGKHHRNVQKAYDGGYAIGAFNVNNMEIIQGITEAAKELNAPLILSRFPLALVNMRTRPICASSLRLR